MILVPYTYFFVKIIKKIHIPTSIENKRIGDVFKKNILKKVFKKFAF